MTSSRNQVRVCAYHTTGNATSINLSHAIGRMAIHIMYPSFSNGEMGHIIDVLNQKVITNEYIRLAIPKLPGSRISVDWCWVQVNILSVDEASIRHVSKPSVCGG